MPTYYVDGAVGDNANAGTSEGAGNAWATIDYAINQVSAGDKIWVKASANYNETIDFDAGVTSGTSTGPVVLEGYTTTTGDGGRATIDGQSTRANCIASSSLKEGWIIKNFNFTGATADGVSGTANIDNFLFINCHAYSNGSEGFYVDTNNTFVSCKSYSNTHDGFECGQDCIFIACVAHSNGTYGFRCNDTPPYNVVAYNCLAYGTGANNNFSNINLVFGCTSDSENTSTSGVSCNPGNVFPVAVVNSIFHDAREGVYLALTTGWRANHFCGYNLITSVVNGEYLDNTFSEPSGNNLEQFGFNDPVAADPNFTDEANDDYTLASGSAAKDAGIGVD